MPTVSFLMSNYNTNTAYLRRALDSVLAQTYTDFEVVILDDGSTDGSLDVIREYAARDSRIRLCPNPHNMGLAPSLNRGLQLCRGVYVARFDTDDICYPDRLEKQVAFMDAHPEYILSGAWADVFETDETKPVQHWQPVMCAYEEHRIRLLFGNNPFIIHPTVIFRREMLLSAGVAYDTDLKYRYTEDYRMWVLCSEIAPIGILEYPVIKYRCVLSNERITVRHAKEMEQCTYEVQKDRYRKLGIELTPESFEINNKLLMGRKPYDLAYRKWMRTVLKQNKKYRVYEQKTMESLLYDRWYTITYYGIAYEKKTTKRIRYYFHMNVKNRWRFIHELVAKTVR